MALPFFGIGMKTDLFQPCGHCWVFQIGLHIEFSILTASLFRIWNSSAGIPSPPLALFIVMLPKSHLTSYYSISGSWWVTSPLWFVSDSLRLHGLQQGSSVHGTFQTRVLEWGAIAFSVNCFSPVQFCATPKTAAHQAPPSLGFSRQEHWSGLQFPSPRNESEKWKWSRSVLPYSSRPHGLQPTRLLHPWDFPGKSTGVGCHCLLQYGVTVLKFFNCLQSCQICILWLIYGKFWHL